MFFLYKNWRPHTVFVWQDFSHWEMCRIMIQIYIKKGPYRAFTQRSAATMLSLFIRHHILSRNGCPQRSHDRATPLRKESISQSRWEVLWASQLDHNSYSSLLSSYSNSLQKKQKKLNPFRKNVAQSEACFAIKVPNVKMYQSTSASETANAVISPSKLVAFPGLE